MPNLEGLGFENYRIFKDFQYLKFSPITILTGANNAGKSSVFKGLLLLKDSIKNSEEAFSLNFSGKEHFLGSVENIMHDKELKSVKIALPFPFLDIRTLILVLEFSTYDNKPYEIALKSINVKDKRSNQNVITIEYIRATKEDKEKRKNEYDLGEEGTLIGKTKTEIDINYILSSLVHLRDIDKKYFEDLSTIIEKYDGEFNDKLKKLPQEELNVEKYNYLSFFSTYSSSRTMKKTKIELTKELEKEYSSKNIIVEHEITEKHLNRYEPKIVQSEIYDLLFHNLLEDLDKSLLPEDVEIDKEQISYYFKKTWESVFNYIPLINHTPSVRGILSRIYNLKENNLFNELLISYNKLKESVPHRFINKWLVSFEIGTQLEIKPFYEYDLCQVKITKESNSKVLVDLGYGLMQLVTILIQIGVQAAKNKNDYGSRYEASTLLIEEPETNLHPKWQSKLAEMFADAKNEFNIQFIIESHSEYMIRGFQNLVANQNLTSEDIGILYLRNLNAVQNEKKQISEIKIKDDGSIPFKLFDSGFFDERIKLKHTLLNINFNKQYEELNKKLEKIDNERTKLTTKIKNLEVEFNDTFENKEQLEIELEQLKKSQVEKNAEYEALIDEKIQEVQNYVDKFDFRNHEQTVEDTFPHSSKFQSNTKKYLASGYHLLEIYNDDSTVTDYAPVVIQFGRAVECEVIHLFKSAKDDITSTHSDNFNDWVRDYQNEIQDSSINFPRKYEFRDYIKFTNDKFYKISFGQSNKVLQLMRSELDTNIDEVRLLKELRLYLETKFFKKWDNIRPTLDYLSDIVEKRNDAAHTYSNSLESEITENYVTDVQDFLKIWTENIN